MIDSLPSLIEFLSSADEENESQFKEAINSSIALLGPNIDEDFIARKFGATISTVRRWKDGQAAPHPALRRWVFLYLCEMAKATEKSVPSKKD